MSRGQSGQAAAEYAWIAAILLGGAAVLGWPAMRQMLEAYATYEGGIYSMIDGALP